MKPNWNWWLSEKSNTRTRWVGILHLVRNLVKKFPTGVKGRQKYKAANPSQTDLEWGTSKAHWRTHGS
jgi:hypothetical protein